MDQDCAMHRLVFEANHQMCSDYGAVGLTRIDMKLPEGARMAFKETDVIDDLDEDGQAIGSHRVAMKVQPLHEMSSSAAAGSLVTGSGGMREIPMDDPTAQMVAIRQ
jgi:hypothetical protein